jgi:hypothetical protein
VRRQRLGWLAGSGFLASLLLAACTVPPVGCDITIAGSDAPATSGEPLPGDAEIVIAPGDIDPSRTSITTIDTGDPSVELVLREGAAAHFETYTSEHVGSYLLVAVDGAVVLSPAIGSAVSGGVVQLSGASDDVEWVDRFTSCAPVEILGGG